LNVAGISSTKKGASVVRKTLFEIECYVDGHTYIIKADDSEKSLDIERNGLVEVLYRWSHGDGPLDVDDVCDILDSFHAMKSRHEINQLINKPRFSSSY